MNRVDVQADFVDEAISGRHGARWLIGEVDLLEGRARNGGGIFPQVIGLNKLKLK